MSFDAGFQVRHGQSQTDTDIPSARQCVLAALVVARCLIFEVSVEGTAANAHDGFRNAQRWVGHGGKWAGRPFPNVADQLVDAAHARAARKFVDRNWRDMSRSVQVGTANIERLAPRISPLGDPPWR